mmetsp:Transcript_93505/g.166356  ORF Transcript_93505/g.166356 Transcript_93505/m.166356 type:complete len:321 (-) Transcript_93505:280-1242(-)|eukprot:CAMPEP_0197651836 /NCGR_PEP_ID=MMETSP1338-20131121/34078_1 /TAXON_ID=43686 ORGANISM="Pelagodinium beii, Strain RCC1491" /NCGR_SAMPLE_ID=MMETSP1338 /ASSEMBLY_ACC=CAM_ASM_000754 /LENGTH=320 /DNA_ID=CAMNT_0043226577 /DNA_START=44 /DNA_END=1006 /DNA_ORIENTATION=+
MSGTAPHAAETPRSARMPSAATTPRVLKEKAVRLPRALTELQQAARLQFKVDGRTQFFNEDGSEIKFAKDLEGVRNGARIDVRAEKRSPFIPVWDRPMESTFKADFVEHDGCQPSRPVLSDDTSVLTQETQAAQFEGKSCYAHDFAPHLFAADAKRSPRNAQLGPVYGRHFLHHGEPDKGQTMYKSEFVKHELNADLTGDTADVRQSVLTQQTKGKKMENETSYRMDYGRNNKFRPEPPVKPAFSDNDSTLTNAVRASQFAGESVYQECFHEHPVVPQPNSKPLGATTTGGMPFKGSSEYKEQYITRQNYDGSVRLRHIA